MYAYGTDTRQTELANTITLDNHMEPALFQCWHTVYDAGPTFGQRCRITIKPGALPSKHETSTQCCFDVGPTSETAGQHSNNIHLDHSIVFAGWIFLTGDVSYQKYLCISGLIQICTYRGRYMHTNIVRCTTSHG